RTDEDKGIQLHALDLDLSYGLSDSWSMTTGVRGDKREDRSPLVPETQTEGERYDLAFRFDYNSGQDWSTYTFAQMTANATGTREDNNRLGVGASWNASERLSYEGEVSAGDLGEGARLGTEYLMSDRTTLYLNYALENERTDNGVRSRRGNMSSGFRTRYSDTTSVYLEEKYSHGDVPTGLTHSMGIDLAPDEHWNMGLSLDMGVLEDRKTGAETERKALGGKLGYGSGAISYSGALEYVESLMENPDTSVSKRSTWLIRNSLKVQMTPASRFIGKLDHSDSESSLGEFYDGNYTEAVVGYGYRPVTHDDLNMLLKYTYFKNIPAVGQVTLNNTSTEFIQKTHILSFDLIYDLTSRWSVGAKVARRNSQVSQDRVDPQFFDSRAELYVLRTDWHFVNNWEFMLEGRMLKLPDARDQRSGALAAFYYHLGQHIKLGIGYNFTDFSDDLTDLDYDSQGYFINLVTKM
ncbi:MAG: flagellar motor protein MotB, partial [Gammaproteobacteria bacterium]|nr:flagellar motor protein MotB [Gammaproteobacteria bacterium]